ncbi:hypothetical protein B0J14DRAFT_659754 [Halenospora varia]|nr:hypothetical protein B0J14DRAFT_659754 [Halenospora varia]
MKLSHWPFQALATALPKSVPDLAPNTNPVEYGMIFHGTINGTAEQRFATFKRDNPHADHTVEANLTARSLSLRNKTNPQTGQAQLLRRPDGPPEDWGLADHNAIWDGIDYLRSLKGTCKVADRNNARVSCSWDSAIYL